jgi:DNA repair protein RadC
MKYDEEFINGLGAVSRRGRRPANGNTKGKATAKRATKKVEEDEEEEEEQPEKKQKDLYYKKRDYPFESVDNFSESVRFIRRFANLVMNKIEVRRLVAFIKSLQRAIVTRKITKKSPHARDIGNIQEIAIDAYKHSRGNFVFVELDEKLRDKYYGIGRGEKLRGSISILKRFVSLIGLNVSDTKKRINSILKSLKFMYDNEIIKKNDPYYDKVKDAELSMKKALRDNKEIVVSNSALNGLHGVIQYEEGGDYFFEFGGTELNGLENAETEIVDLSDDQETVPAALTAEELDNMQFDSVILKGFYGEMLSKPERNFFMCVYGKPWHGKSSFVIGLSKCYAEDVGSVAYISPEQHASKSQQLLLRSMDARKTRGLNLFQDFEAAGDLRQYACVVIDSGNAMGLSLYDAMELKKMLPRTCLIVILQTTKEGDLKGEQGWRHIPDIVLKVEDRKVETEKNRYRTDPISLPIPFPFPQGQVPEPQQDQAEPQQDQQTLNGSLGGRVRVMRENEIELFAKYDVTLPFIAENVLNKTEGINIGSLINKKPSKYTKLLFAIAEKEIEETGADVTIHSFKFSYIDDLRYHRGTAYFEVVLRGTFDELRKVAGESASDVFIYKWDSLAGIEVNGKKPEMVFNLGAIKPKDVPEIKLTFVRNEKFANGNVKQSSDAADFARTLYEKGEMDLQEQFMVMFLNRRNRITGYYKLAKGGLNEVTVDPRLIFAAAVKSLSSGIMVIHNHPSGGLKPSEQDIRITKKLRECAAIFDINLMDHIILTSEGYYSFADEGLV